MSRIRFFALTALCSFCWVIFTPQIVVANEPSPILSQDAVPTIAAQDLQRLLKKKNAVLLFDVRQPEEFAEGHIEGATLMPLNTIPDHIKELPKEKRIVVYCKAGKRSAQAVSLLLEHGFTKAVSLAGGYQGWLDAREFQSPKNRLCCAAPTR